MALTSLHMKIWAGTLAGRPVSAKTRVAFITRYGAVGSKDSEGDGRSWHRFEVVLIGLAGDSGNMTRVAYQGQRTAS